jgi:hypothetical protein
MNIHELDIGRAVTSVALLCLRAANSFTTPAALQHDHAIASTYEQGAQS